MMARGGQWSDSNLSCICPVCESQIEIFNDDVPFSMELHMQCHKPFEIISEEIDKELKAAKITSNSERNCVSTFYCPQCKEDIKIFNNDISTSLRTHNKKHNSGASETLSADQLSSTSSAKSKSSFTEDKYYSSPRPLPMRPTSMLDTIFGTMSEDLRSHRGYIMENSNGRILCCLCNVKIEHLNGISDHLKTKLHEDNIIIFVKKILPNSLHQIMEFVSFYGSNLCCNLCRCKIDLCSTNPHETIVNIMAHNTSKTHLKKKPNTESSCYSDPASIVKSLAQINPLINENKHYIYCKLNPQLRCMLCNKHVEYNKKDNELLKNLTAHFTSKGHKKCLKAISLLESFKSFNFSGKEKHNLVMSKGSICCTVCKCSVGVNLETMVSHVKEINDDAPKYKSFDLSSRMSNLSLDTPSTTSNTISNGQYVISPTQDIAHTKIVDLNVLLKSLPVQFQNINYIICNDQDEVTCLICNCVISATTKNLEIHLTGKNHRKKENASSIVTSIDINQINKTVHQNPFISNGSSLGVSNTTSDDNRKYSTVNNDVLLNNLMENDHFIKINVKPYLVFNDDHYSCNICKSKIQMSNEEELLKEHLMSHFCGAKHKKQQRKEREIQNFELINLLSSDPIATVNKKYLEKQDDKIVCMLCKCSMSVPLSEKALKANVIPHLTGQNHLKQIKKLNLGVGNSTFDVKL